MLVNSDGALHDSMSYHTDALTHFGLRFKDPSHERRFMQSGRVPAADVAETVFSAVSDGQLGGKGGTGLALARARHVLKLHSDSRMHVRSDGPSRGTAVCFTLNLKLADATSAAPVASRGGSTAAGDWASPAQRQAERGRRAVGGAADGAGGAGGAAELVPIADVPPLISTADAAELVLDAVAPARLSPPPRTLGVGRRAPATVDPAARRARRRQLECGQRWPAALARAVKRARACRGAAGRRARHHVAVGGWRVRRGRQAGVAVIVVVTDAGGRARERQG
jgi:hypothetical protein